MENNLCELGRGYPKHCSGLQRCWLLGTARARSSLLLSTPYSFTGFAAILPPLGAQQLSPGGPMRGEYRAVSSRPR